MSGSVLIVTRPASYLSALVNGSLFYASFSEETYVDVACLKSFVSRKVRDSFPLVSLPYCQCNLSGSMTQGDKEKTGERQRGMQGRGDDRDTLEKGYTKSYFSDPVSKSPLTYHSAPIDEDPMSGGEGIESNPPRASQATAVFIRSTTILLHSPPHALTHPLNLCSRKAFGSSGRNYRSPPVLPKSGVAVYEIFFIEGFQLSSRPFIGREIPFFGFALRLSDQHHHYHLGFLALSCAHSAVFNFTIRVSRFCLLLLTSVI